MSIKLSDDELKGYVNGASDALAQYTKDIAMKRTVYGIMHTISLVAIAISFTINVALTMTVHELRQEIQSRDTKILIYEQTVQRIGGLQFQLGPAVPVEPQKNNHQPHVAGPDA